MLNVQKNTTNYLITTLSELTSITGGSTYYLMNLVSENTNQEFNLICEDVTTHSNRYNKLKLIESTVPNLTGSTVNLGEGTYIYKVYEQTNNTNIDPNQSGDLVERGLLNVSNGRNGINYIKVDSVITFKVID